MKRFIHPLLMLLARATDKELVKIVEYLRAENRILRSKLPKHIQVTPAERGRLIELGARLGTKIRDVITIVQRQQQITESVDARRLTVKAEPAWIGNLGQMVYRFSAKQEFPTKNLRDKAKSKSFLSASTS
jgi:predicted RNA-binding protein YlqC (UPF0109 family)